MNDTAAYSLAICELFNPTLHGLTTESSPNINGQYLVQSSFTMDEFMEDEWTDVLDMMKSQYASYPIHYKKNDYIRNYKHIIESNQYFKLDIVKMIELPGVETVGIIKTNGLKRFQKNYRRKHQKSSVA